MEDQRHVFRNVIDASVGISSGVVLVVPIWFLIAALGTQWGLWGWQTGLEQMTHVWGMRLLAAGLALVVLTFLIIAVYGIWTREMYGKVREPVLGLLVVLAALGWTGQINGLRDAHPAALDITTNVADPPGFSTSYRNRRQAEVGAGARNDDTILPGEGPSSAWPGLQTLTLADPPDRVYALALQQARTKGWRIGAASRGAGMFEAGTSEFWFGFHDDMVIRIRDDGQGGSLVDMRSVAREPVHDLGRNAQRVEDFMLALQADEGASGGLQAGADPAR